MKQNNDNIYDTSKKNINLLKDEEKIIMGLYIRQT